MAEVTAEDIEATERLDVYLTVSGPDVLPWVRYTGAAAFLPERVHIRYERTNGEVEPPHVTLTGPRLRKSGDRGSLESSDRWVRESEFPEWLRELVDRYRPAW